MTVKERQCLLTFLGYDTGGVDGIAGRLTRQAVRDFQSDSALAVTGETDAATEQALRQAVADGMPRKEKNPTDDWWEEIEFFDREEFKCTCGGRGCSGFPVEPVERLVRNADDARRHFGSSAPVSSGVRCKLRNSELPGSAGNSLHMRGKAMDFAIYGVSSSKLAAYLRTLPEVDECYEINGSYVHMGVQKYS